MANRQNIVVGAAAITIDGVDAGYTTAGVVARKTPEFLDVDADQVAGIIRKEMIGEKMFITTTMLETTLTNIRMAMNEPADNVFSGSGLNFGSASPQTQEHVVRFTGKSPQSGTRAAVFWRCISVNDVEIGAYRNQIAMIAVQFECLKDPDHGDHFGNFVDTVVT